MGLINIPASFSTYSVRMDRWQNKVAVVTGASSGIGAAIAKVLVQAGLTVVGLARRSDRVLQLRESLPVNLKPKLHSIKCDVSKEEEVISAFSRIEADHGGTDVLINNAGIRHSRKFQLISPGNTEELRAALETNVMGTLYCTREAFDSMKSRKVDGHIMIMNSLMGHSVYSFIGNKAPSPAMYGTSKFALTAMAEIYRQEFVEAGTRVRMTNLTPGLTDTELMPENLRAIPGLKVMSSEDVADAVISILSTPPHVAIHQLTIKPVGERI